MVWLLQYRWGNHKKGFLWHGEYIGLAIIVIVHSIIYSRTRLVYQLREKNMIVILWIKSGIDRYKWIQLITLTNVQYHYKDWDGKRRSLERNKLYISWKVYITKLYKTRGMKLIIRTQNPLDTWNLCFVLNWHADTF